MSAAKTMNIQQALSNITKQIHLTQPQMEEVMRAIMNGEATDAQIGALMMGLRLKGESIDEITAAARVMREFAVKIDVSDLPHLVDIVGTGGDGQNLFNVSTASSFVIAAAGATIAKHGGRGVSSKSGSSDLLEQAGIHLDLSMQQTERCIREMGVGFLFAPNHHKAMKYAAGPRKELGFRSIFNLLGPLTNPAVHSKDGLDEISLASATYVAELKDGKISEWEILPEAVDIESQTLTGLSVASAAESLALVKDALGKKKSDKGEKAAAMIALNAGAGIYVAGLTKTYKQGVALAHDIIYGGQALEKMSVLSEFTKTLKQYPA